QELDRLAKAKDYDQDTMAGIYHGSLGDRAKKLQRKIWGAVHALNIRAAIGSPGAKGWSYDLYCELPKKIDYGLRQGTLWVLILFQLALDGLITRIRQCEVCRSWIFIGRRDQKYCSEKCCERSSRGTSAGKAKRAMYMRRYRAQLKRRDHENVRVAKARGSNGNF